MNKLPRLFIALTASGAIATLALAGCSTDEAADSAASATNSVSSAASSMANGASESDSSASSTSMDNMDHHNHMEGHNHAMDGGPAPEGMVAATDAKFPVGSKVKVLADHMPGMKGAEAEVVGVFNTTTYSVSYTPTDGSAPVQDHRWVVQEELENPGQAPLADGTEITINADHMPGMKGAKGTVDYSTQEPVYMITIDNDGMTMKNHKWVTESELQAEKLIAQCTELIQNYSSAPRKHQLL